MGAENLAPTRIPACSESLYRVHYPGPGEGGVKLYIHFIICLHDVMFKHRDKFTLTSTVILIVSIIVFSGLYGALIV
jgi:hypothetical protein